MRAAIFNWLFARHHKGAFLLRIEDTDRERSTPEAVQAVLNAMDYLGLDVDEEPLYQSSRMDAHLAAAEDLVARGLASREDVGGKGECIVFKMPGKDMSFEDEIKGTLRKAADDMKDLVIVRSNGTPVFHLANVVDDIFMGVTHVIRGDDHVENTYRHIALYEALGAEVPRFAHLPMIVNAQGKPYSKRDGAAFVGEFKEHYLGEALFNYLALLGWSPGDDREVMSRDEMIEAFNLKDVKSSPAQMDMKKFNWMNGAWIRLMPRDEYATRFNQALEAAGLDVKCSGQDYLNKVVDLMQERTTLFEELPELTAYFFKEDYPVDEKAVKKRLQKDGMGQLLTSVADAFEKLDTFAMTATEEAVQTLAENTGQSPGFYGPPIRLAVTGILRGPGLYELLEVLGQERVVTRLRHAAKTHCSKI
jgi:glutamyl-tRNA synthetase